MGTDAPDLEGTLKWENYMRLGIYNDVMSRHDNGTLPTFWIDLLGEGDIMAFWKSTQKKLRRKAYTGFFLFGCAIVFCFLAMYFEEQQPLGGFFLSLFAVSALAGFTVLALASKGIIRPTHEEELLQKYTGKIYQLEEWFNGGDREVLKCVIELEPVIPYQLEKIKTVESAQKIAKEFLDREALDFVTLERKGDKMNAQIVKKWYNAHFLLACQFKLLGKNPDWSINFDYANKKLDVRLWAYEI